MSFAVLPAGGVAQAVPNGVAIQPASVMVAEGGSVTVGLAAKAPILGLTMWALELRLDPSVVTTEAAKCDPLDSPPGAAAFATSCEAVDADEDGAIDTVRVLGVILLRSDELLGDVDCSGRVKPSDSLKVLRFDVADPVAQTAGCPDIGTTVEVAGVVRTWGDVDCRGSVKPSDSLKILRFDAGDPAVQPAGCPKIGDEVAVDWGLQGQVVLARITFDAVGSAGQCGTLKIGEEPRFFVDVIGEKSEPTAANGEICIR